MFYIKNPYAIPLWKILITTKSIGVSLIMSYVLLNALITKKGLNPQNLTSKQPGISLMKF